MTIPWTHVEPRTNTTQIDNFSSGEPIIDDWFHQNSAQEHTDKRVITHVCVDYLGQVVVFSPTPLWSAGSMENQILSAKLIALGVKSRLRQFFWPKWV